jgi:hypothetical protein
MKSGFPKKLWLLAVNGSGIVNGYICGYVK